MNPLQLLIERNPQACYTQLNDTEMVILQPIDENFYNLNESAIDLWLALETPKTIQALTHRLAEKYSGRAEAYHQDVLAWAEDAKQKGLLTIVEMERE